MKNNERAETILIIDDEPDWIDTCFDILSDEGYNILTTSCVKKAIEIIDKEIVDLVITDLVMPQINGIDLIKKIKSIDSSISVILMTSYPSIESAIPALKEGASDYLIKPFSPEQLIDTSHKTLDKGRLLRENKFLRSQIEKTTYFGTLLGQSQPMKDLFFNIQRAANLDANILIVGESGTGKELIAQILHRRSFRLSNHFVPINCASIPADLLESELFGHEVGSFTGATTPRIGLFENADKGTVFLDEIGEMSLPLQAKLLRVIEDKKVRRVGSNKERKINVRFISATNRDLSSMMSEKTFREDLFYRLNAITISAPPLRERQNDICLLLHHFLEKHRTRQYPPPEEISTEVYECLLRYDWPGNVRELSNFAQFLIFANQGSGQVLKYDDLPKKFHKTKSIENNNQTIDFPDYLYKLPLAEAKKQLYAKFEKDYLEGILKRHNWNVSEAAKFAGNDRRTIHRIIKKTHITRPYHEQGKSISNIGPPLM